MAEQYYASKKYHEISMLAEETAKRISKNGDEWIKYLTTAARLYRYPFEDQMLIYAQRPDASACAAMEIWNEKMFCWVKRGSKGIALFDRKSKRPRLKYVFDVSDVHKAKRIGKSPYLWELREEHRDVIAAQLEKTYGSTNNSNSFEGRLMEIAGRIAEDYYGELIQNMSYAKEGSFLEELDELNVGLRLRETLSASIAYTLLSRCGADMDLWKDELNFDYINEFNTTKALSVLGNAVTNMCRPLLMEIGKTIAAYDRQTAQNKVQTDNYEKDPEKVLANTIEPGYNALKRESKDKAQAETITNSIEKEGIAHGTDIREERGLSDTQPDTEQRAGGTADQVRSDAEELFGETPEGNLQRDAADRRTEGALSGDTETGRGEDGLPDGADGESRRRDGGTESSRSDEMGGDDEQHQALSGGDRAERAGIQPVKNEEEVTENKGLAEPDNGEDSLSGFSMSGYMEKQLSLFPTVEEHIGIMEAEQAGESREEPLPDAEPGKASQKEPEIDKSKAVNYHISFNEAENTGKGFAPKEKFRQNVEAIRTLEKIESERRTATPEEQEILAKYVGWGGLADAFDSSKANWANEYQELKRLLSPEEYASARESTLNAHYTSPVIIQAI